MTNNDRRLFHVVVVANAVSLPLEYTSKKNMPPRPIIAALLLLFLLPVLLPMHHLLAQSRDRRDDAWLRLLKRENLSPELTFWTMKGLLVAELDHHRHQQPGDQRKAVDELRRWALEELVGASNLTDCSQTGWLHYLNLINRYQELKKNILPYLLAQKDELAMLCGAKLSPTIESGNLFAQDPYDWLELEDKLYDNPPEEYRPVDNAEALKLMQHLASLYKNRTDDGSRYRLAKVEALINASRLEESSCSWLAWEDLDELEQVHEADEKNIRPYLRHWREQRKEFCLKFPTTSDMAQVYFDDWALFRSQLSTSDLRPDETLERLKSLHRFYRNATGNINRWQTKKLEQLIEVSHVGENKCNEQDYNRLLMLFNIWQSLSPDSTNLLNYLHHWNKEQSRLCGGGDRSSYSRDPFRWRPIERRMVESAEEGNVTKLLEAMKELKRLYENRGDPASLWRLARLKKFLPPSLQELETQDLCSLETRIKFIKHYTQLDDGRGLEQYLLEGEKTVYKSCSINN